MVLDGLSKICYAFLDLGKCSESPMEPSEKRSVEEVRDPFHCLSLFLPYGLMA
jgi:hypothetical protein